VEFVRRFHNVIASTVIKSARRFENVSREIADDLIQDTYLHLFEHDCRTLRQFRFQSEAGIFGFIQSVAFSTVQDYYRGKLAEKRGGKAKLVSLDAGIGLQQPAGKPPDHDRELLLEAIDALLCRLAPSATARRDRQVFWLYYRQGFTAKAISELPSIGLSAKGVESLIQRLVSEVRRAILEMPMRGRSSVKGSSEPTTL
jgi:RNA polymerase sigma-70 factor (ECF subfamily)